MPCMNMTRRIKNTIYQVKVTVVDSDGSNMEDRIIHMIQNQPVAWKHRNRTVGSLKGWKHEHQAGRRVTTDYSPV